MTKIKDGIQSEYPVHENVYLVEADSDEDANQKAEFIGRSSTADDPTLTLDGKPAREEFVGVRKLISVVNSFPAEPDKDRPSHGTEITYSRFTLSNESDIKKLANGESLSIIYEE